MLTKPRILVLYYSQSGQLRDIIDSIVGDIKGKADIDFVSIKPVTAFPFPWKASSFFDTMPETVQHIPILLNPLPADIYNTDYDLVIFGYTSWFLNPSLPISSFLQSEYASILKGKNVITVIGCRNMWLHGQERVKEYFRQLGANLVGNIVLTDTNPNLVSVLTIIRWSFKGKKEASGLLPAAGVQDHDIKRASRFGVPIYRHVTENKLDGLQKELLMMGAIHLKPGLIILERRGVKNFRKWSQYIRDRGGPGAPERQGRVTMFKRLLIVAIFILSPISSLTAFIQLQLQRRSLLKDVEYFKGLSYEPGKF
ncbi:MAG: dialkylresorcinol condensing enzyme DarA [Bacteroidetes bacterium]|nr:dialkylresorcinol condensing enzyme DarA [Bacteroidota bacterium]